MMAHGRCEAFDQDDGRMMELLAVFAAMAVRQLAQQKIPMCQASGAAAAGMAEMPRS